MTIGRDGLRLADVGRLQHIGSVSAVGFRSRTGRRDLRPRRRPASPACQADDRAATASESPSPFVSRTAPAARSRARQGRPAPSLPFELDRRAVDHQPQRPPQQPRPSSSASCRPRCLPSRRWETAANAPLEPGRATVSFRTQCPAFYAVKDDIGLTFLGWVVAGDGPPRALETAAWAAPTPECPDARHYQRSAPVRR